MGEIKSVKVDNWGVFFLQKLQNFFNKTDYCDLTLQFRDNSQLKVHRLVLSACTDYFNVLEQTCEVVDDAIIMPNGLQADVVVPIVNFMYTGTLEFELKMYNRLLRTAKDMNMTVLLKLLEAHRRTMEMHPHKSSGSSSPKPRRRTNLSSNVVGRSLIQTNEENKRLLTSNASTAQNRNVTPSNSLTRLPTSAGPLPVRQIGSTTFTRIKVENDHESSTPNSGGGGYSLIKHQQQPQQPTSPFEQLRKGYNNNKRPAVPTFVSPPAKKPNLEDVKEFAEQQRMRKQIAAEYGDDDYDANNIMDDDTIHNDDDDDEMMASSGQIPTSQTTTTSASAGVQTVASSSQQHQSEDPPGTTTIIVKHEGPDKPPTIVVKDSSNSKMNHAKIISEVLRQYPHLIKSNKNIKLKIMPNSGGQAQKIVVKKESVETEKVMQPAAGKLPVISKTSDSKQQSVKILASNIVSNRSKITQQHGEISQSVKSNSVGTQAAVTKSVSSAAGASSASAPQKRRIDSKTMHALIALGAENTTGPWLCLRCGRNGHPISIPSYRGFRRHLINTHKEFIDPDLCEHCGWRSSCKRELHFHMQMEHKVKTNLYIFPECQLCQQMCIDSDGLNQHLIDSHPDENKQQCIYCNKIFPEELQLYTHMKTFHKKQALEDGIIDYSDDENQAQMTLPPLPPVQFNPEIEQERKDTQQDKKVKIISDISLPITSSVIKTDAFAHRQETTVAAASEEYLQDQEHDHDNETKFVAADGSEVILTAEQRKEILSQLNQEHEGSGIVMVLNENDQQQYDSVETQPDQGVISHDETSQATTATNEREEQDHEEQAADEEDDQHDDNQIYNEMKSLHSNLDDSTSQTDPAEGTNEEISQHADEPEHDQDDVEAAREHEHLEESKESIDNLEWAENLISEHDLADEVSSEIANENKLEEKEEIKDDEISKKLRELTGDWSEDDDDDMPEDSLTDMPQMKEDVKQKAETSPEPDFEANQADKEEITEKLTKKQEEVSEFEDHAELLASLQNTEKDEIDKSKESLDESVADSENIDEDDIDKALKRIHNEDIEQPEVAEVEEKEKLSGEKIENKDTQETIESEEKAIYDAAEQLDKTVSEEEKKSFTDQLTKNLEADDEKPEEKLVKELEKFDEPEASSTTMEVDEVTKKDLIDSLLSDQAETMEDTATETPAAVETEKKNAEFEPDISKEKNTKDSKEDLVNSLDIKMDITENEEFLDATPEKKENLADNVDSAARASNESASTGITVKAEASSTSAKEETTLSSEERVKSLISEWGDDDEDEDENDTANL